VQAINASKPYLEKKLAWCEEAVETTGRIAASDAGDTDSIKRFWVMYWGVMGLIEHEDVAQAMINFGDELRKIDAAAAEAKGMPDGEAGSLRMASLSLARACRAELAREWSAEWRRN
jgi:hypothetical protein